MSVKTGKIGTHCQIEVLTIQGVSIVLHEVETEQ
jgi:hypothetical protein